MNDKPKVDYQRKKSDTDEEDSFGFDQLEKEQDNKGDDKIKSPNQSFLDLIEEEGKLQNNKLIHKDILGNIMDSEQAQLNNRESVLNKAATTEVD